MKPHTASPALALVLALMLASGLAAAQATAPPPAPNADPRFLGRFKTEQLIAGPDCLALKWSQKPGDPYGCSDAQLLAWRQALVAWRTQRLQDLRYDDKRYRNPALQWAATSFVQTQAMVHDRYLYDPVADRWTVDRFLDDLIARYGGIDSVLLWSIYPNIGIDNRNQLQMIEELPGGVDGVRRMVADFKRRGVRVLFPIMPWDTGTAALPQPLPGAMAALMRAVGADGVNGDTMTGVPEGYSQAAEAAGHPLVFEPEIAPLENQLGFNLMSWGYFEYPHAVVDPAVHVAKLKWLEPRHMVHVNDRWQRQRSEMLQFAFFNGTGFHSWENIWGIWNGITPRDAEVLRRMATVQRAMAPFLTSPGWEPMAPTLQYGVLASRWPHAGATLWTLVNRNEYAVSGAQLALPAAPAGTRWFELFSGRELAPARGRTTLDFDIEPKGMAAVLASTQPPDARLLAQMQALSSKPLATFSDRWQPLPQRMLQQPVTAGAAAPPAGMRAIPAARFDFNVHGVMVEGINMAGTDVQFPWEDSPRRFHRRTVDIGAFHIDTHPVTNADYKRFLDASGYAPQDAQNHLRHWLGGTHSAEQAKQPVVWVSLDDARAYARWAGKRLPTSWEWQYAAQGTDGRAYPWGNQWNAAAVPAPDTSRNPAGPAAVDAHPQGASPFGVLDLVGNVWQWTDEFADEHTRAAVLRGGSRYRPQGSHWYFPQAQRLDEHGKFLLMSPGMDRNAMTGFRCVVDGSTAAP